MMYPLHLRTSMRLFPFIRLIFAHLVPLSPPSPTLHSPFYLFDQRIYIYIYICIQLCPSCHTFVTAFYSFPSLLIHIWLFYQKSMLSNYSVIDLPSESYMVSSKRYMDPWLCQRQQPNRLKTSQSAHRLPTIDRANIDAANRQLAKSTSLTGNYKRKTRKRNFENNPDVLNTNQLLPSMLRSRSSSVTSNDCLPTPSSSSNDHTSMHRQASSESEQADRPPSVATILSLLPPRRPSTQPQPSPAAAAVAASLYGTPLPQRPHGIKHSLMSLALSTTTSFSKKRREANVYEWPYVLVQDHQEQDRLVAQHYLLRMTFGSDFAAAGAIPFLEKNAVVLDVGCGPGAWTMEMATQFPKATFIGIDQTASFPQDIKPKNCHFRQFHITNGFLPFPDNSVDYIFQRDLNWGLTIDTWKVLVKEYMRILKPGGWIELVEPDLETQSSLCDECAMNDKREYTRMSRKRNIRM